ncbi:MAG: MFS transporter [Aggregatilineales bacterium]
MQAPITNPSRARTRLTIIFYLIDMILFGLATSFLDPSTVVPNFVGQATKSEILIGLSGVLFTLVWRIPQLLTAPTINRAPRKLPWMLFPSIPGRMAFLVIAAITALVGREQPGVMLLAFFVGYAAFAFFDGIATNAWVELIGNAVSTQMRGVMFGIAQVIALLSILGVQGVLRVLLGPTGPGYPVNYAIVFAIAGGLLTFSLLAIRGIGETPVPPNMRISGLIEYLPYLSRLIRQDRAFRHFLVMRFLLDASIIAGPFYIGYEVQQLGIDSAQAVSDSLLAVMVGGLIGSALSGWLGGRRGSRAVIAVQVIAVLIGPLMALLSLSVGRDALLVTFAMIGLVNATFPAGLLNWLIEHAPAGERPTYSGVSNTLGIAALIVPLCGGVLLQATSYGVLFAVALVIGLAAMLLATGLAKPGEGRV